MKIKIFIASLSLFLVPISIHAILQPISGDRNFIYATFNIHTNLDKSQNTENAPTWGAVSGTQKLRLDFRKIYGRANTSEAAGVTKDLSLQIILYTPTGELELTPPLTNNAWFNDIDWDTTAVPDGTYVLGVRYLDGPNLHQFKVRNYQVIVDNTPGAVTGNQQVPVTGFFYDDGFEPPSVPDWVSSNGTFEDAPAFDYPYKQVPSAQTLPQQGMELVNNNTKWYVENLSHMSALYDDIPGFIRDINGNIASSGFLPQASDTSEESVDLVERHAYWCLSRGRSTVSPYSTYVPNPINKGWIGIDLAGRIFRVDEKGFVVTLIGWVMKDDGTIPFDWRDTSIDLNTRRHNQARRQGTFMDGEFKSPNDLVFDPNDPTVAYVADTDNHRIAKVQFNVSGGKHQADGSVTTYAGIRGQKGYANGSRLSAQFDKPYSLDMDSNGIIYVADRENQAIRTIDTNTGVVATLVGSPTNPNNQTTDQLKASISNRDAAASGNQPFTTATINFPQVLRLDSLGHPIIGEDWTRSVRRVNLNTQTVEHIEWLVDNGHGSWLWLDVDTKGVAGPIDDIFVAMSISLGVDQRDGSSHHNEEIFRISKDGSRSQDQMVVDGGWPTKQISEGMGYEMSEAMGHYVWAVAIDDEEARFVASGYGNTGLQSLRMALPSDPVGYEYNPYVHGMNIYQYGTAMGGTVSGDTPIGFPHSVRPGLSEVHGVRGFNSFGNVPTFDELAMGTNNSLIPTSNVSLANYIMSGMAGSVPRPEMTGRDLAYLIYYIRRTSIQQIKTGQPISFSSIESDLNAAGLHNSGDSTFPTISNIQINQEDGDTIRVQWTTDEPTIGLVAYGNDANYGLNSDIEPALTTNHDILIHHMLSDGYSNGTYHFGIYAKDLAGNLSISNDVVFTVQDLPGSGNNQAPTVDVGSDQIILLSDSANLDATVSDDGLPGPPFVLTLTWSQVSGPGTVSFADRTAVDTTATFSAAGTYVLRLMAFDGSLMDFSELTVIVNSPVSTDPHTNHKFVNVVNQVDAVIPCSISLRIVDRLGSTIKNLTCSNNVAIWDGTNNSGEASASGIYSIIEDGTSNRKVAVLR